MISNKMRVRATADVCAGGPYGRAGVSYPPIQYDAGREIVIPFAEWVMANAAAVAVFFCLFVGDARCSVRQDMEAMESDAAVQVYYLYNQDCYTRSYIIRYAPDFLKSHGMQSVPSWLQQAVAEGLQSPCDNLVQASIEAAGRLRIPGLSDVLTGIFIDAPVRFGSSCSPIRCAVLQALLRSGDPDSRVCFQKMFASYQFDHVFNPEFSMLVDIVASFGDESTFLSLVKFSSVIDSVSGHLNGFVRRKRDKGGQRTLSRREISNYEFVLEKYQELGQKISNAMINVEIPRGSE